MVKKERRTNALVGGMIMKSIYFTQDELLFLQSLQEEKKVEDRSKFVRACVNFARQNKENLNAVLAHVQA